MYSAYSVPSAPHHSPNVSTTTASSATLNSTTTTWSSSGSSMHPTYTSFDPGPSTSGMYGGQGGVFSFPPYPSMHMPFDYQQVGAFSPKKNLNKLQINFFRLYLSGSPCILKSKICKSKTPHKISLQKSKKCDTLYPQKVISQLS